MRAILDLPGTTMKKTRLLLTTSFLISGALAGSALALPALPGTEPAPAASSAAPGKASAPGKPVDAGADTTKRGLCTVEQNGRILGVGTILAGDGRVLTASSALGTAEQADLRYADGHTVRARVGHRDKTWDLALLVPLSGKWTEGLVASEANPEAGELKVFTGGGRAAPAQGRVKARVMAHNKDGTSLPNMLEMDLRGSPQLGAPLVDATGAVVGILVRACKPGDGGACAQAVYGAPVPAIRNFLVKTPLNAVTPSPWLGIVGAPDAVGNTRGVRVMAVAPQSPAEKSGLKTNADRTQAHLIVAVDGRPVDSPEGLAELINKHSVGETVKILVLEAEKFKEVSVVLRAPP